MPTYEMAFMAIASKNSFLTHEEAAQCLAEFQAQPAGASRRSVDQIALENGLLTAEQVRIISSAAKKVVEMKSSPAPGSSPRTESPGAKPAAAPGGAPPQDKPTARHGAAPSNPSEPIPGIRILGKLGVGGTATVFLADDTRNNRKVALKIIHPSLAKDERAVKRFHREASLLISFDHPNLVHGYAQGAMGPLAYFLMEYLEGESAQEVLDHQKQFSEAQSLEIIMETAKAIDHMQGRGIIHRDIKPGNIFLLRDGRVKVLDLGFAQEMHGGDSSEEETTSGTVQYMSPEQARGQRDLDVRADIYSLGATLYHMVMGELPFSGSDSLEVMAKQVMEALNSSEIKNRRLSKHMHYFIERMMSKEKDLRYPTPRELVEDINEQIEGFKSLEYRPDADAPEESTLMKLVNRGDTPPPEGRSAPSTRRLLRPPTTRHISKLGDLGNKPRFKKK